MNVVYRLMNELEDFYEDYSHPKLTELRWDIEADGSPATHVIQLDRKAMIPIFGNGKYTWNQLRTMIAQELDENRIRDVVTPVTRLVVRAVIPRDPASFWVLFENDSGRVVREGWDHTALVDRLSGNHASPWLAFDFSQALLPADVRAWLNVPGCRELAAAWQRAAETGDLTEARTLQAIRDEAESTWRELQIVARMLDAEN